MHPAIRSQSDTDQELYSDEAGLDCSNLPDTARQEFKKETDVNDLLARYGVGVPQQPTRFAAADFDMDLQQALDAISESKQAWAGLPDNLKRQYTTWQELLTALDNGSLVLHNEEPVIPPAPEEPAP